MREVYADSNAEAPEDEGPTTAVGYLHDCGESSVVIDLLTEMLVKLGKTEAEVAAELERLANLWLRDQQEQWWER